MNSERCIVWGCTNPVVRVLVHKSDPNVCGGLRAFHGDAIIRYGTEKQARDYVFPGGSVDIRARTQEGK